MARTKEIKKDIMEFWFYQWMMEEKKITFDDYCGKSENDITALSEEFHIYYQTISKE